MSYDFTDPYIVTMVSLDHSPTESFRVNVAGFSESNGIRCDHCQQEWPCPAIQALRDWKKAELDRMGEDLRRRFADYQSTTWVIPPVTPE